MARRVSSSTNGEVGKGEFVIFSQYGFFLGLEKGGRPVWTMEQSRAKPFDHPDKFLGLQRLLPSEELLIEYI